MLGQFTHLLVDFSKKEVWLQLMHPIPIEIGDPRGHKEQLFVYTL